MPQEPVYGLDLEAAKAALAEAGFADGEVRLAALGCDRFPAARCGGCQAIADQLGQAGFNVELQITDIAALIDGLFAPDKPGLFFHVSWSSNGDPQRGAGHALQVTWRVGGHQRSHGRKLLEQGVTTTDTDARAAVYAELQQYLWQNLIHIPLYNSDFTVAHAASVQGIKCCRTSIPCSPRQP